MAFRKHGTHPLIPCVIRDNLGKCNEPSFGMNAAVFPIFYKGRQSIPHSKNMVTKVETNPEPKLAGTYRIRTDAEWCIIDAVTESNVIFIGTFRKSSVDAITPGDFTHPDCCIIHVSGVKFYLPVAHLKTIAVDILGADTANMQSRLLVP